LTYARSGGRLWKVDYSGDTAAGMSAVRTHILTRNPIFRACLCALALFLISGGLVVSAVRAAEAVFHVDVGMVVVSFTVRDEHGNYVSGLKRDAISVREDGIEQRIQSFVEASEPGPTPAPAVSVGTPGGTAAPVDTPRRATVSVAKDITAGNVFILFDTSNGMYSGFAQTEDEIESFVRNLDPRQAVAIYSFSRNMTRLARLTKDHEQAIREMRTAAAGDSTAVLNATLLTLRDAARAPGRHAVVVFSNGPDNSSIVTPADVARVAENEGAPIYIISTKPYDETAVEAFEGLANATGGKLFQAATRASQVRAFHDINADLNHTYTVTYYPQPNQNEGWRHIEVQVLGANGKGYKVTSRNGYLPMYHYGD
jgi:Ca-activated chloride channel family protein